MPDPVTADAPGRVNLIGEHTDYHEGFVLPTIIPQRTRVQIRRRDDRLVRAASATLGGGWQEYSLGREAAGRGWLDYVQGVTVMLARSGYAVPGFDAEIDSAVPLGAGLSSSAALEVSLLRALRTLVGLEFDDVMLARIGQTVETQFVGAPVGIMDQMAASLGRENEALFLDTRSLTAEHVSIPSTIDIVVIDSGVTHQHAGGEYAIRRRESFAAAEQLGVGHLRDADESMLSRLDGLPVLHRRARHVVTENARVLSAVSALRQGDAVRLGQLFAASHASMRDDYEITTPDIDTLVETAQHHHDVFGSRMTGGGFGGSVVVLVRHGAGANAARAIRDEYNRRTGRAATVLVPPSH